MFSQSDKSNCFKTPKPGQELNPSYLYDVDLLIQAKSWLKTDARHNHPTIPKASLPE